MFRSIADIPPLDFVRMLSEAFELGCADGDDGSDVKADRSAKPCLDCKRMTNFRRCPRCWQKREAAMLADRKKRKKVQNNGASLHVPGMPIKKTADES